MTFEEWWETDTTTWDNGNIGTLVKNACWLAYRAGQAEMRERAARDCRKFYMDVGNISVRYIEDDILILPLEGDE